MDTETADPHTTWPALRRKERTKRRAPLLGATVADQLRGQIVEHGLEPGTSLPSEAELADEFDVSLRVVRDALRTLTNQGIIETRQGKRAMVANLRPVAVESYFQFVISSEVGAVEDLLDLRLAVETQAARAAAANVSDEEVVELRGLLDAVIAAGDDPQARASADVAFHRAIARASRNRFFSGILEALNGALHDERGQGAHLPPSHDLTNAQHRTLLEAIEARDPEGSYDAMAAIVVRARELFQESNRGTRGRAGRPRRRRTSSSRES